MLYYRSHCSSSELISIELVRSYCMPLLLYAVEATAPPRQAIRMLDRCIDSAVKKIFKVSNNDNCKKNSSL